MHTAATVKYGEQRDFSKGIIKAERAGKEGNIYEYNYNLSSDIKEKKKTKRIQQQDISYYYPSEVPLTTKSRPIRLIKPEIEQTCQAYLTSEIKDIIAKLTAIILTRGHNSHMEIESILITAFYAPEENWSELVFNIAVRALPTQALAFWDYLGKAIDQWKIKLSEKLSDWYANLLTERISIDVFWV